MKNKRDFQTWLNNFRESIAGYSYYIDFNTVYKNVSKYQEEIKLLDSLIGSENIEKDFEDLLRKHPSILKVIPTMLAKRESNVLCCDTNGIIDYRFDKSAQTIEQYKYFMQKTGLFDLFKNHVIHSATDLFVGIEIGLNSNARKNRGGHLMEDLVEKFIQKAGYVKGKTYFKEMYLSDIEKKTGLDLSALSNMGNVAKRFDYVLFGENTVYACECNFYASGGSKLNETARSYKTLANESKNIKGFKFVWFTDGKGWLTAKNNLKETFDVLDDLYNIVELEDGVIKTKLF